MGSSPNVVDHRSKEESLESLETLRQGDRAPVGPPDYRSGTETCCPELLQLIDAYLTNALGKAESARFVAHLLFPDHPRAREFFLTSSSSEQSQDQKIRLRALTTFPDDPITADLKYRCERGDALSDRERIELFSRSGRLMEEVEQLRSQRAQELLVRWQSGDESQRMKAIAHLKPFIEFEMESVLNGTMLRPSTNQELSALLNISPQEIGQLVFSAITEDVGALRLSSVRSARGEASRAYHFALSRLCRLVRSCEREPSVESEALGIKRLCDLFDVTPPTMRSWLEKVGVMRSDLPPHTVTDEMSTTWKNQFKRPAVRERAIAVVAIVRGELARTKEGNGVVISSNEKLASLHGVSAGSIYLYLRDGLTEAERLSREFFLRSTAQSARSEAVSLELSVLQTVRGEIEEHQVGRRANLSTVEELAYSIGCSVGTVNRHLRSLSSTEEAYRKEALLKQKREGSIQHLLVEAAVSPYSGEVEQRSENLAQSVKTVRELAATFGISEGHAGNILRRSRRPELRDRLWLVRLQGAQKRVNQKTIERRDKVVAFVKEEIRLHQMGELPRLSHIEDLIKRFGVSVTYLYFILLSEQRGQLTEGERAYRRSVLARQSTQKTFAKHGHPFARMTPEKRAKTMEALRTRRNIRTLGMYFDSVEEAVCAECLTAYVPGWKPKQGVSCQVQAGYFAFDFRIGRTLVEYHPMLLFWSESGLGDFSSQKEYDKFRRLDSGFASRDERLSFRERVTEMLAARYVRTRQKILNSHTSTQGNGLVWVGDAAGLYDKVVAGYAPAVSRARFIKEFSRRKRELSFARKKALNQESENDQP